jgi:cyclopropane-fatty-acyl-phospholipid synthase
MTKKKDIEYSYGLIDKIFRLSIGETGDLSCALYNGDFSLSLEQAQRRKHEFIYDYLSIGEGSRVLDMGCGWGPFLNFLKEKNVKGVGVTLSDKQMKSCKKNGFEVYVMDCKTIKPETFGLFDAMVSLGAFEHFCSVNERDPENQKRVYNDFFKTVYNLLPAGGRFYLQTMTFNKNMIDYEDIDINAEKKSDAHILALVQRQFPRAWLPVDDDQIIESAKPYFKLLYKSNGRLDYIETISQWRKRYMRFTLRKYTLFLSLLYSYLSNREFRQRLGKIIGISPNQACFERELLNQFRFVFEKE